MAKRTGLRRSRAAAKTSAKHPSGITLPLDAEDKGIEGKRLEELRTKRGLSQLVLYATTGMAPGRISEVERGHRGVTASTLKALAVALGTSADYLLGLSDDPSPRS